MRSWTTRAPSLHVHDIEPGANAALASGADGITQEHRFARVVDARGHRTELERPVPVGLRDVGLVPDLSKGHSGLGRRVSLFGGNRRAC
jgi:hypothetical protein